jgi:hypothetical protein
VVAWSRLLDDQEAVLAINTAMDNPRSAWVTIDALLHKPDDTLRCIYSTDSAQIGQALPVERNNGRAVRLTVPPAGFVIFE